MEDHQHSGGSVNQELTGHQGQNVPGAPGAGLARRVLWWEGRPFRLAAVTRQRAVDYIREGYRNMATLESLEDGQAVQVWACDLVKGNWNNDETKR